MFSAALLRHLDTLGLLVYGRTGADGFLERLPDAPVDAVAVYARPGGADTDGGHGYDEPAAQFVVRGNLKGGDGQRAGYQRARDIRDALHGLSAVTLGGGTPDETYVVQLLATQSEPTNLGGDPDGNPRWSVPVRAEVYRPTVLRP